MAIWMKRHHAWLIGLGAALFVVLYWKQHPGTEPTNTLFSGLAFVGLVMAILLQRQELIETRQQVQGQRVALEGQQETMALQREEATFFQLVSLHHELVRGMVVVPHGAVNKGGTLMVRPREGPPDEGREGFKSIYNVLTSFHYQAGAGADSAVRAQ